MGTSGLLRRNSTVLAFTLSLAASTVFVACGDDSEVTNPAPYDSGATGGSGGGTGQTGGAQNTGGLKTGGAPNTGGVKTGGAPNTGGAKTGGAPNTGGAPTGGAAGATDSGSDAPTSNGDAADGLAPDGN